MKTLQKTKKVSSTSKASPSKITKISTGEDKFCFISREFEALSRSMKSYKN